MDEATFIENSEVIMLSEDNRVVKVYDSQYFEDYGHSKTNPLTGLGSGDCALYLNVLPEDLAISIFEDIDAEIEWCPQLILFYKD